MINESNRKMLDKLEITLKDQLLWSSRNHLNVISETVDRARTLKQFIIGLSIAIISLVFPILISVNFLTGKGYFILSFIEFCIVTLWGLISLILPTLKELVLLPVISNHHIDEVYKMIKRVQEIKKIEDDGVAHSEFNKLEDSYKKLDLGKINKAELFFGKYEDLIMYSIFFVSFALLVIGIFKNLTVF
jgi:hypothetical protein